MPTPPVRWPQWRDWRAVLAGTWSEAREDNIGFLAAGVAFYAFLAFVPLLAAATLIYGLVADPGTVAEHIRALFRTLPRAAAAMLGDQLKQMTATPSTAKGISLAASLAIALYGASKGASGITTALNIAYEVRETRGFLRTALLALAMTVGGLIVLALAVAGLSLGAAAQHLLPASSPIVHGAVRLVFWLAAFAGVSAAIALVYRFAPSRPDASWRWISPGSAAASLVWLIGSLVFGLYAARFGHYNATYGSLGGVIVFLTWLYLSAYILLLGGELNSELEKRQASAH